VSAKVGRIAQLVEELAPRKLAEDWDRVGLQVGDPREEVTGVLVALELTEEVLDEAVEQSAEMVVVHHPLIFKGLSALRYDSNPGYLVQKMAAHGFHLYVAHTNLDAAVGGTGDLLAKKLALEETEVLVESHRQRFYKLVVFLPQGHEDEIRDSLARAGAGWIGNYSHCTFQAPGTGTFKPLPGTDPFVGKVGQVEKVSEYRLETIVPEDRLKAAVKAMKEAHPYEEVAYDVYPLAEPEKLVGSGRVGRLKEETTLRDFIARLQEVLGVKHLRYVGDLNRPVRKVGVLPGSGGDFVARAASRGADVYVTGDVKYHQARLAEDLGLAVVDPGHYATETPVIEVLAHHLQTRLREEGSEARVYISRKLKDPFQFL